MDQMSKIPFLILGSFLTVCSSVQALDFYSTLNPGSTPGNFSGELHLSFSTANSLDYGYNSTYGKNIFRLSSSVSPTYTDPSLAASVYLSFVIGIDGPPENNYLICNFPSFYDASIGQKIGFGNLTSFSDGPQNYSSLTYNLQPGAPSQTAIAYTTGNQFYSLNDGLHPPTDTMNFSYSLLVDFDGTTATGSGVWSLTYTGSVTPVPAPEPAAGWLAVAGGSCCWLAWARRRRVDRARN